MRCFFCTLLLFILVQASFAQNQCDKVFGNYKVGDTTFGVKSKSRPRIYIPWDSQFFLKTRFEYSAKLKKGEDINKPKSFEEVLALLQVGFELDGRAYVNLSNNLAHSPRGLQKSLFKTVEKITKDRVLNKVEAKRFFLDLFYLSHQNIFQNRISEIRHWDDSARKLVLQKLEWSNFHNALVERYANWNLVNMERGAPFKSSVIITYYKIRKYLSFGILAPLFIFKRVRDFGDVEAIARHELLRDFNKNFIDFMESGNWRELEIGANVHLLSRTSSKILKYSLIGSGALLIFMYFYMSFDESPIIVEQDVSGNLDDFAEAVQKQISTMLLQSNIWSINRSEELNIILGEQKKLFHQFSW